MKNWFLVFVAAAMAIIGSATPGRAQRLGQYPWCSQYMDRSGARSCAFDTYGQCRETVNGIGGFCYYNLDYVGAPVPQRKRRR